MVTVGDFLLWQSIDLHLVTFRKMLMISSDFQKMMVHVGCVKGGVVFSLAIVMIVGAVMGADGQ